MPGAIPVSDSLSNFEEQIERAAKVVGRGKVRPKVFAAIYHHKAKVKSASWVVKRTRLPRLRVLQEARHLVRCNIANSARATDGETAYEMIDFFHTHKRKILNYAADPKKLAKVPTKRKAKVSVTVSTSRRSGRPKAVALTVDDIDSFAAVRKVRPSGNIPRSVSEDSFKRGVQRVIGDVSVWKDWGGELFDLATTRVRFKGKRIAAVFAFKGPGVRGPLVPGKMGKNGDQIPRMFFGDGQLFVVQYGEDIKPSIHHLMRSLAVDKSVATGQTIYYAAIDGMDSYRLYRAYPQAFVSPPRSKRSR